MVLSNTGNSLQVSGNNPNDGAMEQLPIVPGRSYTVTFDLSILSGSGSLSLILVQKEGESYQNFAQPFSIGTNSMRFTATVETYLNITLNTTGAQVFRMDNLGLKQTGIGAVLDYYAADVLGVGDYYAFGMEMVGRTLAGGRYGFNGKENDDEAPFSKDEREKVNVDIETIVGPKRAEERQSKPFIFKPSQGGSNIKEEPLFKRKHR